MNINAIIISEFYAEINKIEFNNEDLYYCVLNTLTIINDLFNINLNNEFISDLKKTAIELNKEKALSFDEIYNLFEFTFKSSKKFDDVEFKFATELETINTLNNKIKNYIII